MFSYHYKHYHFSHFRCMCCRTHFAPYVGLTRGCLMMLHINSVAAFKQIHSKANRHLVFVFLKRPISIFHATEILSGSVCPSNTRFNPLCLCRSPFWRREATRPSTARMKTRMRKRRTKTRRRRLPWSRGSRT